MVVLVQLTLPDSREQKSKLKIPITNIQSKILTTKNKVLLIRLYSIVFIITGA